MTSDLTTAIGRQFVEREDRPAATPAVDALALIRGAGLRHIAAAALSIRRRRCGRGWIYFGPGDRRIEDHATVKRPGRISLPPPYQEVLYAEGPTAHLHT